MPAQPRARACFSTLLSRRMSVLRSVSVSSSIPHASSRACRARNFSPVHDPRPFPPTQQKRNGCARIASYSSCALPYCDGSVLTKAPKNSSRPRAPGHHSAFQYEYAPGGPLSESNAAASVSSDSFQNSSSSRESVRGMPSCTFRCMGRSRRAASIATSSL
jgi:hypothetical protein